MKIKITIVENNYPLLPGESKQPKVIIYYLDLTNYSMSKQCSINTDGSLKINQIELIGLNNNEVLILPVNSFFNRLELEVVIAYYDMEYPQVNNELTLDLQDMTFWDNSKQEHTNESN